MIKSLKEHYFLYPLHDCTLSVRPPPPPHHHHRAPLLPARPLTYNHPLQSQLVSVRGLASSSAERTSHVLEPAVN